MEADARPARASQKWGPAEEDMLLHELCGDNTLSEVAARHGRTPGAIAARLDKLLTPQREFVSHEDVFSWARSEMHQRRSGPLSWAWDRAATAAVGYPMLVPGGSAADAAGEGGWTPARVTPATARQRAEVITMWSSLVRSANATSAGEQQPHGKELDVLAEFDNTQLHTAATAVLHTTGALNPAQWVLEADWPGIQQLTITAEQIRSAAEEVRHIGADLLAAGLGRDTPRDREIMQLRLGFTGNAMRLNEVALRFDRSPERIRQIQDRAIKRAWVGPAPRTGVRRGWHHVHDTLLPTLSMPADSAGPAGLDPDLVLSFVELAAPLAPRVVAVELVASLCGLRAEGRRALVAAVEQRHEDREQHRREQSREEK